MLDDDAASSNRSPITRSISSVPLLAQRTSITLPVFDRGTPIPSIYCCRALQTSIWWTRCRISACASGACRQCRIMRATIRRCSVHCCFITSSPRKPSPPNRPTNVPQSLHQEDGSRSGWHDSQPDAVRFPPRSHAYFGAHRLVACSWLGYSLPLGATVMTPLLLMDMQLGAAGMVRCLVCLSAFLECHDQCCRAVQRSRPPMHADLLRCHSGRKFWRHSRGGPPVSDRPT